MAGSELPDTGIPPVEEESDVVVVDVLLELFVVVLVVVPVFEAPDTV